MDPVSSISDTPTTQAPLAAVAPWYARVRSRSLALILVSALLIGDAVLILGDVRDAPDWLAILECLVAALLGLHVLRQITDLPATAQHPAATAGTTFAAGTTTVAAGKAAPDGTPPDPTAPDRAAAPDAAAVDRPALSSRAAPLTRGAAAASALD